MAEYVKPLLVTLTSCIEVLVRVMVALFLIQIPVHAPRKAEDGPNTWTSAIQGQVRVPPWLLWPLED